jgi:hypothetical protein
MSARNGLLTFLLLVNAMAALFVAEALVGRA